MSLVRNKEDKFWAFDIDCTLLLMLEDYATPTFLNLMLLQLFEHDRHRVITANDSVSVSELSMAICTHRSSHTIKDFYLESLSAHYAPNITDALTYRVVGNLQSQLLLPNVVVSVLDDRRANDRADWDTDRELPAALGVGFQDLTRYEQALESCRINPEAKAPVPPSAFLPYDFKNKNTQLLSLANACAVEMKDSPETAHVLRFFDDVWENIDEGLRFAATNTKWPKQVRLEVHLVVMMYEGLADVIDKVSKLNETAERKGLYDAILKELKPHYKLPFVPFIAKLESISGTLHLSNFLTAPDIQARYKKRFPKGPLLNASIADIQALNESKNTRSSMLLPAAVSAPLPHATSSSRDLAAMSHSMGVDRSASANKQRPQQSYFSFKDAESRQALLSSTASTGTTRTEAGLFGRSTSNNRATAPKVPPKSQGIIAKFFSCCRLDNTSNSSTSSSATPASRF
jgi:hypothetical protein